MITEKTTQKTAELFIHKRELQHIAQNDSAGVSFKAYFFKKYTFIITRSILNFSF